jgi:hypothetical protein
MQHNHIVMDLRVNLMVHLLRLKNMVVFGCRTYLDRMTLLNSDNRMASLCVLQTKQNHSIFFVRECKKNNATPSDVWLKSANKGNNFICHVLTH